MGGPVQPRQWLGRQIVQVAPGGKECFSDDILSKVCTDAPAGVRKNGAVIGPNNSVNCRARQSSETPDSSITLYVSG
jgi:hypothetical protein